MKCSIIYNGIIFSPENGRAEFKVLSSQAFCLGDGKVGLACKFLPPASLWFSVAFFLCYKWIVALCQQVKYSSAGKENVYRRDIQHTYTSALCGLLGISHFLKTPLLSINAPFIFPSTSWKWWRMNGSVALLHNSSENSSHRKPPLSMPYRTSFVQLGGWCLSQLFHGTPILLWTPKARSSFAHQTSLRASFVPGIGDARESSMDITLALPLMT